MDFDRACIVLGVKEGTPADEAKKRYRARARLLHPDVASHATLRSEAEHAFKELNAAWEIYKQQGLSDDEGVAADTGAPGTPGPFDGSYPSDAQSPQGQAHREETDPWPPQSTGHLGASAPTMSAQDARNTRFTVVPRGEGYDKGYVDRLRGDCERALVAFEEGVAYPGDLDVLALTFLQGGAIAPGLTRWREGYDTSEVDAFVEEAGRAIDRWQASTEDEPNRVIEGLLRSSRHFAEKIRTVRNQHQ